MYHAPIIKTRQNKRGGGVAIYCLEKFNLTRMPDLETDDKSILESITAKIQTDSGLTFLITSLYLPPNTNIKLCQLEIQQLFEKLNNTKMPFIISGDLNIDLNKRNAKIDIYSALLESSQLIQHVRQSTRITCHSSTLIDHIITNSKIDPITKTLTDQIADHQAILTVWKRRKTKIKPLKTEIKSINTSKISENLSNHDWNKWIHNNKEHNPDQITEKLLQIIEQLIAENTTRKNIPKNQQPKNKWIKQSTLQLRMEVLASRRKFLRKRNETLEKEFKQKKKSYEKALRNDKINYYHKEIEKNQGNSKKIWEIINEITGKKSKKNTTIPTSDTVEKIASNFNIYFRNIATNIEKNIPPPKIQFERYLSQTQKPTTTFKLSSTTTSDVIKVIAGLK